MIHSKNKKGSALFIVLGCVALMTLLVVAFLGSSMAERTTSNYFAKEMNSKLLAENAVNLVISQIRTATKSKSSITGNVGNVVTWASQPGMIRTYNSSGGYDGYYKLYSWSNMIGAGQYTGSDVPDTTWASEPDLYTDINEAVNSRNPIISGVDANGNPLVSMTVAGTTELTYGSVSSTTPDIEGFYVDPTQSPTTGTTSQVPMPVQWIYILRDGTQVSGTVNPSGSGVLVNNATASNPIVGRIAFWTDDECSKVNINTAGEGTSWDVPTTWFQEDYGVMTSTGSITTPLGMSTAVPNSGEYQRLPGHPATTDLSTVFGQVLPLPSLPYTEATYNGDGSAANPGLAAYYTLTPRYAPGGTKGGSRPSFDQSGAYNTVYTGTNGTLVPIPYRLYASVDELIFDPARMPLTTTANGTIYSSSTAGISPLTGRPQMSKVTPSFLNEAQFFLTANSKAPETTLFNTPRISIWPLSTDTVNARNAKDNLLAYCATVSGTAYYFQRSGFYASSTGSTSPILGPAGGAPGSSQDMAVDMGGSTSTSTGIVTPGAPTGSTTLTGTGRNQNLMAYLQAETSANIPGFGGNFLNKYPGYAGITDRDQILVDIFDYIRSTVNTFSVSSALPPQYTYTPVDKNGNQGWAGGTSLPEYVSMSGTTVMGLGRTCTIAEVTLVFIPAGFLDKTSLTITSTTITLPNGGTVQSYPPGPSSDGLPDDVPGFVTVTNTAGTSGTFVYDGIGDPQTTAMQAYLLIRPFTVDPSIAKMNPCLRFSVSGLDKWSVAGLNVAGNLGFLAGASVADGAVGTNNGSKTVLLSTAQYSSASSLLFGVLQTVTPVANTTSAFKFPALSSDTTRAPQSSNGDNPTSYTNYNGFTTGNAIIYPLAGSKLIFTSPANPSAWGGQTGNTLLRSGQAQSLFSFSGGKIQIMVSSGTPTVGFTAPVIQTYDLNFPPIDALPIPSYVPADPHYDDNIGADGSVNANLNTGAQVTYNHPRITYSGTATAGQNQLSMEFYTQLRWPIDDINARFGSVSTGWDSTHGVQTAGWCNNLFIIRGDTVRSLVPNPKSNVGGDMRVIANLPVVPYTDGDNNPIYNYLGTLKTTDCNGTILYNANAYDSGEYTQFSSLVWDYGNFKSVMMRYMSGPTYNSKPPGGDGTVACWTSLGGGVSAGGQGITGGTLFTGATYADSAAPCVTPEMTQPLLTLANNSTAPGDWSNGYGNVPDGPLVQGADEGTQTENGGIYQNPWYELFGGTVYGGNSAVAVQSYSPNRQIASPVMFGTLPATVHAAAYAPSSLGLGSGWHNLLFCPNPATNDKGQLHPGFGVGSGVAGPTDVAPFTTPPDHLLLDLFWMPIVEPYAISEPLATAGKINMNYQIVPFSYIHRSTAVRAVLKSVHFLALPNTASSPQGSSGAMYKETSFYGGNPGQSYNCRYAINLDETIDAADSGFQARFKNNDIFRSASEICNIFLVPAFIQGSNNYLNTSLPASYTTTSNWWSNFQLTGINSRESPYNQIYPRLTTKSNTFQVHFRVQTLVKNSRNPAGTFDSTNGDSVGGEYRGSSIVERYIDPNDKTVPDFAAGSGTSFTSGGVTLDAFYRYKVTRTKSFNP